MSKKQIIERILCVLIPLFITGAVFVCICVKSNKYAVDITSLAGIETIKIVMGIWGTLLGFSIAAESILIAIRGGEFTALMVSSGHLKTMLFSFMITNISLFVCLILFIPVILNGTWNLSIYKQFICSLSFTFTSLGISLMYFFIMLMTVER